MPNCRYAAAPATRQLDAAHLSARTQAGLQSGLFTSVDLVKVKRRRALAVAHAHCGQAYFARIAEVNLEGPMLRAVIETNPSALAQAAALDAERLATGPRSLLHGIPVLVKDNIATDASEGGLARSRAPPH